MKSFPRTLRSFFSVSILSFSFLLLIAFAGCRKFDRVPPGKSSSSYSAEVIDKWITLQARLMVDAATLRGIPNHALIRPYAYSGIAAYEALGRSGETERSLSGIWNGLDNLPKTDLLQPYYWPASVNTALAFINRNMFSYTSTANKASIDSLENALNELFLTNENSSVLTRSNDFGIKVGNAVFNWSETDGYKDASSSYTVPVGPGNWVPTPPAFAMTLTPFWGNNRPIVKGSLENTGSPAPPAYSEEPGSAFYQMAKEVYDVSLNLTDDQKAMALFWRDVPGATTPGHELRVLEQVITLRNSNLSEAALAYAFTGTCGNDALISCWRSKYKYTLLRPISYIRTVLAHPDWNSFLTNPAHPEYPSAHAVVSNAVFDAFDWVFGRIGRFTDHTYDYLGFQPRSYGSFGEMGLEAAQSRLYAGIHYQPSINAGIIEGKKVTANIIKAVKERSSKIDQSGL